MIILDTDHVTVFKYRVGPRYEALVRRLEASGLAPATTVISLEESTRGWLAVIAKERQPIRQVTGYRELAGLLDLFAAFSMVSFDEGRSPDSSR